MSQNPHQILQKLWFCGAIIHPPPPVLITDLEDLKTPSVTVLNYSFQQILNAKFSNRLCFLQGFIYNNRNHHVARLLFSLPCNCQSNYCFMQKVIIIIIKYNLKLLLGGMMLHQNHSQSYNELFCQCFSYKVWFSLGF